MNASKANENRIALQIRTAHKLYLSVFGCNSMLEKILLRNS